MGPLIETSDLSKAFDGFMAVDGVTLSVEAGEVLALLGPNGAGKTTTIRMLASILRPTRGWARVAGHDCFRDGVEVRRSVGMLTEHHGLYTRMLPLEYLRFFGQTYGFPTPDIDRRAKDLLERFELGEARDKRLAEFSKGMRQKLALARAMLHEPVVLLLDEPTSAMDPASARLVRESIAGLRSSKRALVVCTHNLAEAEILADRIAIIERGRIMAQGTPEALKQSVLGAPIMEVRLGQRLNGARPQLPEEVMAVEYGVDWIRYQVAEPERTNPKVLAALADSDLPVVTLTEVGRTLEEVYLQVVRRHDLLLEAGA
jgi:ABC-2 type transport system ATP-binding protein